MKSTETLWHLTTGEFAARHLKILLITFIFILMAGLSAFGHSEIRTDLHYALASASAQLSPLFVAYDTAGDFSPEEVLQLTQPEIKQAVKSWPHLHASIGLQILNTQGRVILNSQSGPITTYKELEPPVSRRIHFGDLRWDQPLLYIDWAPSRDSHWLLRATITPSDYLKAHAWRLLPLLILLTAIGQFVLTYDEVRQRRRFDRLIGSMSDLLRQAGNKDTLIHKVPQVIAFMLDFDSVAVYWIEGDHIIPKWCSSISIDFSAFLHSTDGLPSLTQGNCPEARAIQKNAPVLVDSSESSTVHLAKHLNAKPQPYLIVPIRRGGDGLPVGLLTAQRNSGFKKQHTDFLQSGAEIVALLLENINSREALERFYRKMIRNTRIETLGTLVPFIAHNMKTPLVVVEGLAESISKDLKIIDQAEVDKRILEIKEQTNLCFQLIRSISQYNKLDAAPKSSISVRDGLEKVCRFFRGYFRVKNVTLEQIYEPKFEPYIRMEELDFIQVITNLLINVDDAFSEMTADRNGRGNRIDSRIKVVLEPSHQGNEAMISLIDNGPGIRPEHISRIFEQDFTTKNLGTGVGLPYCRRVVEQAGGTIDVKSPDGEGTTVSILLPITTKGEVKTHEHSIGG